MCIENIDFSIIHRTFRLLGYIETTLELIEDPKENAAREYLNCVV